MANWKKLAQGAAGAAGGAGLNVEEVFSTYLYDGNGSTQTITNGIDLSTEGGMVWIKNRNDTAASTIHDTERGATYRLIPSLTNAEFADTDEVTSFNSDGFTVGADGQTGFSGRTYASWTFRKAPKFFDVVTYTGNGTNRTINHNLGSTPGMIIIKCTSGAFSWAVWHRGINTDSRQYLWLNSTNAVASRADYWNTSDPTDSAFPLGTNGTVNSNGQTYVAYLFAHNDGDGEFGPNADQDIIKCGSFSTDSGSQATIDLGFEPSWVMYKKTNSTGQWYIEDTMRGLPAPTQAGNTLIANLSNAEGAGNGAIHINASGFETKAAPNNLGASNDFIYIAIRRGPMAVPESATDVFAIDTQGSTSGSPAMKASFPVDMATLHYTANNLDKFITSRLTQGKRLETSSTDAEASASEYQFDYQNGWWTATGTISSRISHMWRRAPSFFDVVAYTGNGTAGRTVSHNLGVAPEMMWVKRRDAAGWVWAVYHSGVSVDPETDWLQLNDTNAVADNATFWNDTSPTDTQFTVGTYNGVNASSGTYIAYLFASLDGVSKVGSYTGNGSSQTIDCGFSSGARFVLIKRTDSTGDWYVWNTERGIVAGNDPYLKLNTTDAEVTSTDWVDPDNSGFIVNGTTINASSASFIFYAIA